jgi:hypothetical protein
VAAAYLFQALCYFRVLFGFLVVDYGRKLRLGGHARGARADDHPEKEEGKHECGD